MISCSTRLAGPEQLETLDELVTLAAIHQDIAEYYQELYAASREVPALLEHFYHRVSSIRYLTKLDAWSPTFGGRKLQDRKARRLKRLFPQPGLAREQGSEADSGASDLVPDVGLLKDNGSLHREALRLMRWRMIRALRGTFWREREKLLGEVPELTLLSWAEALRENVRRFMARTALHPEAKVRAELFGKEEEPADGAARLAANIRTVLCELWDDLDRIEADVHEARLDSVGVLTVRGPALARRLGKPPPPRRRAIGEEALLDLLGENLGSPPGRGQPETALPARREPENPLPTPRTPTARPATGNAPGSFCHVMDRLRQARLEQGGQEIRRRLREDLPQAPPSRDRPQRPVPVATPGGSDL